MNTSFTELLNGSIGSYKKNFGQFMKLSFFLHFMPMIIFGGLTMLYELLFPKNTRIIDALGYVNDILFGLFSMFLAITIIKTILLRKKRKKNFGVFEVINSLKYKMFDAIFLWALLGTITTIIYFIGIFLAVFFFALLFGVVGLPESLLPFAGLLGVIIGSIPGIILTLFLCFSLYALITDNLSVFDSIKRSIILVSKNLFKILCYFILILLLLFAIVLAIVIPLIMFGMVIATILTIFTLNQQLTEIGLSFFYLIFFTAISMILIPFTMTFMERFYLALSKSNKKQR